MVKVSQTEVHVANCGDREAAIVTTRVGSKVEMFVGGVLITSEDPQGLIDLFDGIQGVALNARAWKEAEEEKDGQ